MTSPGAGALRLARAGTAAAVVLLLSTSAHVAAGGDRPPPALLVAALALVGGFCAAASDRRWTRPRAVGLLVGGQAALHSLFCLAAGSATAGMAGHGGAGMALAHGAADGGMALAHSGGGMVLAHGCAAVAVGLLLSAGDTALWLLYALVEAVRTALARLGLAALRPPAPAGRPAGRRAYVVAVLPQELRPSRVRRRGPPVVGTA